MGKNYKNVLMEGIWPWWGSNIFRTFQSKYVEWDCDFEATFLENINQFYRFKCSITNLAKSMTTGKKAAAFLLPSFFMPD